MNIIVLGPPGSGKGTQAQLLAKRCSWWYFEAGEVLRQMANKNLPLGKKVKQVIYHQGGLVADKLMGEIVENWLKKVNFHQGRGIIFDGFPRTKSQYLILKRLLKDYGAKIDKVIFLNISPPTITARLLARRVCPRCDLEYNLLTKPPKEDELCDQCKTKLVQRRDDNPEMIKARLNTYFKSTKPLVEFLGKEEVLEEVEGERPIEVIHQDILNRLGKF